MPLSGTGQSIVPILVGVSGNQIDVFLSLSDRWRLGDQITDKVMVVEMRRLVSAMFRLQLGKLEGGATVAIFTKQ